MSYHHDQHNQAYAYATTGQSHAAYYQTASAQTTPAHVDPRAQQQYATASASSQAAYEQAYYQQQQAAAASPSSRPITKSKDKKSKSKKTDAPTLLEVEKQWAAYHEQQRRHMNGEQQVAGTTESARYWEPNFAAFTLAGGRSYLEDGSPSPLSEAGSKRSGGGGY
jgi:hypothetical protein